MSQLASAKRLIVKIGSSLLVDDSSGQVKRAWLETLAADIAACKARGQEVIVVSSGAVAVGRRKLGLVPPLKLEEKQAAASSVSRPSGPVRSRSAPSSGSPSARS